MNKLKNIWFSPPKSLVLLFKLSIGIVLLYFIYFKLKNAFTLQGFEDIMISDNWLLLSLSLLVFSIVNWGIEAKKWQILTAKHHHLRFFQAYGSVLAGLSTGLITPNRIGNFIGRNAYIKRSNRTRAVYETQVGNLAQFLVSILMGTLGFSLAIMHFKTDLNPIYIFAIALITFGLGLLFYYKPRLILSTKLGRYLHQKDPENSNHFFDIPTVLKSKVLGLSIGRYLVFIIQYNLLFQLFDQPALWYEVSCLAASTFLLTTLIPSLLFGKLIVRESSALYVFGWAGLPIPTILLVSLSLWFINLALPGLIGFIIWLKKLK